MFPSQQKTPVPSYAVFYHPEDQRYRVASMETYLAEYSDKYPAIQIKQPYYKAIKIMQECNKVQ